MDVISLTEHRLRAALRQLPPALDAVINRAKAETTTDEAEKAWPTGGGGPSGDGSEVTAAVSVAFAPAAAAAAAASRRQKATVVGNERSIPFSASTALYHGGRHPYRPYPHDVDQTGLRLLMGAEKRTQALNTQLRDARYAKYDADVLAFEKVEEACDEALERQPDGARLRLGRVDAIFARGLDSCPNGVLHRRNQMATWKWSAGFYVLCDGVLYEFEGSSLAAPTVNAWPVLGATCRPGSASSQQFPHVLELRVHRHFLEEGAEVLGRVELAAPTREQRAVWMSALERASLRVSSLFRKTNGKHGGGAGGKPVVHDVYQPEKPAPPTPRTPRSARRGRATSPRSLWSGLGSARRGKANAKGRKGRSPRRGRSPRSPRSSRSPRRRGATKAKASAAEVAAAEAAAAAARKARETSFEVRAGRKITQYV